MGIHHSAAVQHLGGVGSQKPLSFQSVSVVHPKKQVERDSFLPPQITLHTTARPPRVDDDDAGEGKDTSVVLSLPKMRPTDVPDG